MAQQQQTPANQVLDVIDPLYEKYVKAVLRALGSTEFYEYFMQSLAQADTQIQFSNRRVEKIVDTRWVDAVENTLYALQQIIASPRNVIREDELIVDVANVKKTNSDVVRHLATHASLVEDYEENSGEVRPNKLMQKYREDSIGQVYENRVVFTTLEFAYQFVKVRHDALFEVMSDEFGAKLKFTTDMLSSTEAVHMDTFLHIHDTENAFDTDGKNREIFDRISRVYRMLKMYMASHFATHMARYPRIKGNVTKTNVLKKNKNYHAVMELLEFLRGYDEIGYTIKVIEQNPVVDEAFQQDLFHNVLFQYLVLKGHLERDKDRRLPAPLKQRKRALKPKFIKEIIEELTEDYDLPDVEIRKVLIEELTKDQLLKQEAEERRRLVEERAARKKAEQERIRAEKQAEKERLRQQREAERERIRLEKEAEKQRLLVEKMEREQEERRRSSLFKQELQHFEKNFAERMEMRGEWQQQETLTRQDFEDAAFIVEETERIKREEAARARARRREELEKRKRDEEQARQRVLAQEAEKREQQRLAKLALEEQEQRRLEEQQQQQAQEQIKRDLLSVQLYQREILYFRTTLLQRLQMRQDDAKQRQLAELAREEERRKLAEARNKAQKHNWRFWQ